MASSHNCPQYSQLNAVTVIARVQPAHRFQVIAEQFGKRRTTAANGRFQGLFRACPFGRRPAAPQN